MNTITRIAYGDAETRGKLPKKARDLTAKIVRELLRYDPATGLFTWKHRERKWFPSERLWKGWNTQHAGKPALTCRVDGYYVGRVLTVHIKAHRATFCIMTGRWPDPEVDHQNGIRSDNRWRNLREATRPQNSINKGVYSNNTSCFKGVSWNARRRKWAAQIQVNGRNACIGFFDEPAEAHRAYVAAALEVHGEFARCE